MDRDVSDEKRSRPPSKDELDERHTMPVDDPAAALKGVLAGGSGRQAVEDED
jgi:hypothetical protein